MLTGDRVWEQPWPAADPSCSSATTVEIVVQVNGKLRDRMQAPADAPREELEALARERPNGPGAPGRQRRRQGRRRAGQARQLRRALTHVGTGTAGAGRERGKLTQSAHSGTERALRVTPAA